jgi:hypothetical protein
MTTTHTPAPWKIGPNDRGDGLSVIATTLRGTAIAVCYGTGRLDNARLIAAAPDMLAALRLHQAWTDSERTGPNYGEQTRDTHPNGEEIWRIWWQGNLDLCDRANSATLAAIAKAEGRT